MQLSEENRQTLLIALHQVVEAQATTHADDLCRGRSLQFDYPPNGGLVVEEAAAIQAIRGDALLQSALRKLFASCAAGAVFDFLNLIDGTSDPEHGDWSGVMLVDKPEEIEGHWQFLHDAFFETYWDWRAKRRTKNWRLDNLPE